MTVLSVVLVLVGLVLLSVGFVPVLRSFSGGPGSKLSGGQIITILLGLVCLFAGFAL